MSGVHPMAVVAPGATLGANVEIGPFVFVGPHVTLGDGVRIMPHAYLDGWTTLGAGCTVFPFASLGAQTQDLKFRGGRTAVEIGAGTTLRESVTVHAATADGGVTRIGAGCHIMAYVHIAHDCQLGDRVIISNATQLAGHVTIEDDAGLSGACGVPQFVRIGRMAYVGGMTKVVQDVPPYMLCDGCPAALRAPNTVGLQRHNLTATAQAALRKAYKLLCRDGLNTTQALARMRAELPACDEILHLIRFIETLERGIVK